MKELYNNFILDSKIAKEFWDYSPIDGSFIWKERNIGWFLGNEKAYKIGNKRTGRPAFTTIDGKGYFHQHLFYKFYLAHRVAWLWMTGEWPDGQIDHDNRDRLDNRWSNLLLKNNQENSMNSKLYSSNTSGIMGVRYDKRSDRWTSRIKYKNNDIWLGGYKEKEEAIKARKEAEKTLGFHHRHGLSENE